MIRIFSFAISGTATVLAAAVLAMTAPSNAAAQSAPPGVEQFGDWGVTCPPEGSNMPKICTMVQVVSATPEGQSESMLLMRASLALVGPDRTPAISIQVPLGVLLPAGIAVKIDEGEPLGMPYRLCGQDGCRAVLPVQAETLAAMKAGAEARVAFMDATGEQIVVPMSLTGFTAAFDRVGALTPQAGG